MVGLTSPPNPQTTRERQTYLPTENLDERPYLLIEFMSESGESRGLRVLSLGTKLLCAIEEARTADLEQMAVGSEDYPR